MDATLYATLSILQTDINIDLVELIFTTNYLTGQLQTSTHRCFFVIYTESVEMCIENLQISYKIIQILITNFDNPNTFMCEIYENQIMQFYSYKKKTGAILQFVIASVHGMLS